MQRNTTLRVFWLERQVPGGARALVFVALPVTSRGVEVSKVGHVFVFNYSVLPTQYSMFYETSVAQRGRIGELVYTYKFRCPSSSSSHRAETAPCACLSNLLIALLAIA